jgi:hypothetical protein
LASALAYKPEAQITLDRFERLFAALNQLLPN